MTLALPAPAGTLEVRPHLPGHDLVAMFLAGKSAHTLRAYSRDLDDFAAFTAPGRSAAEAIDLLIRAADDVHRGHGKANEIALAYRQHLQGRDLAAATINRHLAALRSVIKLARTLGYINWHLDIPDVPVAKYRDTEGPGDDAIRRMLEATGGADAKSRRDFALVKLMYAMALRQHSVRELDLEHVDLPGRRLHITLKRRGKTERFVRKIPDGVAEALAAWIDMRGREPGPLFVALDRSGGGGRLSSKSVWQIVVELGREVGINAPTGRNKARPHGLRHSGITRALDKTNDLRRVMAFSNHKNVQTLMIYDDNRRQDDDEVGQLVDDPDDHPDDDPGSV